MTEEERTNQGQSPTVTSFTKFVPRVPRTRPHSLYQVQGPGSKRRIVLDRTEMVLGRIETADIHLDTRKVSREHARLYRSDGEFRIADKLSRNGVYLNGIRIHSAILREGDVLQVGDCVFQYREG